MLTILVEYLVAARKTGPRGAGAVAAPGGLAAWLARLAYRLAERGWLAGVGGRGRGGRRPRRRAGAGEGGHGGTALLRFSWNADCSGKRPRRWLYPALPRQDRWRGRALPHQR